MNAPMVIRAEAKPGAVRLLGYNDYRAMFMPIGHEYAAELVAKGENIDARHVARLWAGQHAFDALHRPGIAAACAVAFFARCTAAFVPEGFSIERKVA